MAILAPLGGDVEMAVSARFLGAVTKVVGKGGLYGGPVGAGLSFGAVAAAAGALTAKAWSDSSDDAHALRLAEVRNYARLVAAPGVSLGPAIRQMLASFSWCLSVEERRRGGLAGSTSALNHFDSVFGGDESDDGSHGSDGARVAGTQLAIEKEMRRQVRRIWKLCEQQPQPPRPARGKPEGMGRQVLSRLSGKGKRTRKSESVAESEASERPRGFESNEAYEKLFNPQFNSGDRGLCAALCYLLTAFIRHRRKCLGGFSDGSRSSLRLAVAALARHPVFDEDINEKEDGKPSGDVMEFRRGALALLPLLDAALAWRPVDPWGWLGNCEDDAPLLAAYMKGLCTFPALAARLKKSLNKAASGDTVVWRRLSVHLDSLRIRELPHPWSGVWVQARDASMLVRNHTKVPLRVELHRPPSTIASPWADWPLVSNFMLFLFGAQKPKALITADVGPGIEWAMRPKTSEGRNFELKLVTQHGVVVCSKRLRRGQIFDFKVNVPVRQDRNKPLKALGDTSLAGKQVGRPKAASDADADDDSICSTTAPSSQAARVSIASSSASASIASVSHAAAAAPLQRVEASGMAAVIDETLPMVSTIEGLPVASAESLDTAICPKCLREMRSRSSRPGAETYAEGVQCDLCEDFIFEEDDGDESKMVFFHCKRCWFDMCHTCALVNMQEVWWEDD